MTNELLPCPFCAGEPILNHIEPHSHNLMLNGVPIMPDYPGSWTIECCDVGMIKDTREEVIAAWNRRAPVERQAPEGFAIIPDASNMTDEQAEAIAKVANCCGGIAYEIYCAAIESAPSAPGREET